MDRAEFEALQGETDEETARLRMAALGLTVERLGAADFEVGLREMVREVEAARFLRDDLVSPSSLRPLRSELPPSQPPSQSRQDDEPVVRSYELTGAACDYCLDAQIVPTRKHEARPGKWIADWQSIVRCPKCVPLEARIAEAGIDSRNATARVEALRVREGNLEAVSYAHSWRGDASVVLASRDHPGDNLYGTGKSYIAAAMLTRLIERGLRCRFMAAQDFLEQMKQRFDGAGEQAQAYADRIAAEPVLCLDDFGKAQDTDWARAQMHRLLDARYRAQLVTVVTTNLTSPGAVAQACGGSVASRLLEADWLYVGGDDMRGQA